MKARFDLSNERKIGDKKTYFESGFRIQFLAHTNERKFRAMLPVAALTFESPFDEHFE